MQRPFLSEIQGYNGEGLSFYRISASGLPAWWGRSPLGVSFERAKETKTRLGRSPLRTARHPCCGSSLCHHTRLPWQLAL